jgi:gamma-resorcylate decarboxylase
MKMPHTYAAKKSVADYVRNNVVVTTSGNFSTSALNQSIAEIGIERVLWSADYPFEDISDAADWIDAAPLSDEDRQKIVRTNAQKLFRLKK